MSKKIVAIGGGENGRIKNDGKRSPYETGPMDREIIKLTDNSIALGDSSGKIHLIQDIITPIKEKLIQ